MADFADIHLVLKLHTVMIWLNGRPDTCKDCQKSKERAAVSDVNIAPGFYPEGRNLALSDTSRNQTLAVTINTFFI